MRTSSRSFMFVSPMTEPEFDQYAGDYTAMHQRSVAFSGCELGYFAEYKALYAAQCFREFCGKGETLLDFGCGPGTSIPYFTKHLDLDETRLIAADVSRKSLDIARERFGGTASYLHIESGRLNLDSGSAGMVFSACVFHHIEPERHVMWMAELHRITRPGGVILIFEHNPLNPLTRYAVAGCAFDEGAILLRAAALADRLKKGGWTPWRTRYHVFFPGFLKKLRPLEQALGWLPMGGQYSVLAFKR